MGTQGYIPQLTKKCYSLLFTVIWALIWPQTVAQVLRCRASSQPAVLLILPRVLDQFLLHCGALSLCSQLHKLTSCQLPFASRLLWWMDGFLQAAFGDASSSVRHQTHLLETTDPFQICFFFWTVSHKVTKTIAQLRAAQCSFSQTHKCANLPAIFLHPICGLLWFVDKMLLDYNFF